MLDLWKSKFPKFHRNLRRPDTKNEQPITRRFKASYPQDQPTFQISQFTLLLFSKKQKEKPKKKRKKFRFRGHWLASSTSLPRAIESRERSRTEP